jgi:hypothetical protein
MLRSAEAAERSFTRARVLLCAVLLAGLFGMVQPPGDSPAGSDPNENRRAGLRDPRKPLEPLPQLLLEEIGTAVPLNPESTVFLDKAGDRVVLRTEVACGDCIMEMLLVPENNREHETILRIRSKAYVIHTGLLALGLQPGSPATFVPEFKAADGPEIQMEVIWLNSDGERQQADASDWIRHNVHKYYSAPLSGPPPGLKMPYKQLRWDRFNNEILWYGPMSDADRDELLTKWDKAEYRAAIERFHRAGQSKPMTSQFVFVGSSLVQDPESGREVYQAEGGHLICTSNFGDAMIDVREESSASDGGQTYEGWSERIPPAGTPVLLVLKPVRKKDVPGADADAVSPPKKDQ